MNQPKGKRITLQKRIWCKIRYWQQLNDITEIDLASNLDVVVRTLKEYDKDASNITLSKIDRFLYINDITLIELLNV